MPLFELPESCSVEIFTFLWNDASQRYLGQVSKSGSKWRQLDGKPIIMDVSLSASSLPDLPVHPLFLRRLKIIGAPEKIPFKQLLELHLNLSGLAFRFSFKDLTSIQVLYLNLQNSSLDPKDLKHLSSLHRLHTLDLNLARSSIRNLKHFDIENLPLNRLVLNCVDCCLRCSSFNLLVWPKILSHLEMRFQRNEMSDHSIRKLVSGLSNLRSLVLDLAGNFIGSEGLEICSQVFPKLPLTRLSIDMGCNIHVQDSVKTFYRSLSSLKHVQWLELNIPAYNAVSDDIMMIIVESLRKLQLRGLFLNAVCQSLSDASVRPLADVIGSSFLEQVSVNLGFNDPLTDASAVALVEAFTRLHNKKPLKKAQLTLPYCGGLSQAGRKAVLACGQTIPVVVDVASSPVGEWMTASELIVMIQELTGLRRFLVPEDSGTTRTKTSPHNPQKSDCSKQVVAQT